MRTSRTLSSSFSGAGEVTVSRSFDDSWAVVATPLGSPGADGGLSELAPGCHATEPGPLSPGFRGLVPGGVAPGTAAPSSPDPLPRGDDGAAPAPVSGTRTPPNVPETGSSGRQWELEFPPGLPLLSLNGREHWAARNRKVQALKGAAVTMARKAKVPRLERIRVTVLYDPPPDGRHRDADNLAPTGKALLDGVALAVLPSYGKRRVVPGDDSRHVARVSFEIGPEPFPRGRLRVIVTELSGAVPEPGGAV